MTKKDWILYAMIWLYILNGYMQGLGAYDDTRLFITIASVIYFTDKWYTWIKELNNASS